MTFEPLDVSFAVVDYYLFRVSGELGSVHINCDRAVDSAFQINPDTDPNPIRIQGFDDQKLKEKKILS